MVKSKKRVKKDDDDDNGDDAWTDCLYLKISTSSLSLSFLRYAAAAFTPQQQLEDDEIHREMMFSLFVVVELIKMSPKMNRDDF